MVLHNLLQDLRYTWRTLRRDPRFALFAILIAGLGIGASSTVFSVVNALLLRPLPFTEPDRLVWITNRDTEGLSEQTTQVGHMLDLRERTTTMSALAGYFAFYGVGDNLLTGRGEPERLNGVPVSQNFFDVLGVRPEIGRTFSEDESRWQGPKAVILSHSLWARRFASDPAIVGTSLTINEQPFLVAGVMPASFDFGSVFAPGSHFDLFLPFALSPETNRWGNTMAMIGRLTPAATVEQAQSEVRSIATQIVAAHPERNGFAGVVTPLSTHVNGRVRLALWVLAGAVAAVMLIVCANLSSLLLARAVARQKEIAIRTAVGAGRARIVTQMLTEGIVLSASAAAVGLAVSMLGTRAMAHLQGVNLPLLADVRTDWVSLGFTLALAGVTGVVFGLAPALQGSGKALHDALKDSTRGSTDGRRQSWTRNVLVVTEVAFACVLLLAAGLLVRSLVRVLDVDLGFQPSHAVTVRVEAGSGVTTAEQRNAFIDQVLDHVAAIPGVEAAGVTDALPLGRNRTWGARAKGVTYERGRSPLAFVRIVTDGYAAAMGMRVLRGRDIQRADVASSEPVMLVNDSMARALWPNADPVGKFVVGACAEQRRVVGVIEDVRHLALEQASGNEMYLPWRQCPNQTSTDLVVRSTLEPGQIAGALRTALQTVAPNLVTSDLRTLQQIVDRSVSPRRFLVFLLGGFAAFALVLASLGIYAVVSYSVTQRTREIGIRMALGASPRTLQVGVIAQTVWLAAAGIVVGVGAASLVLRSLRGLLFGISAGDPVTFGGALLLMLVVALAAGYFPAKRASRVDPLVAMRPD